MQQEGSPTEFHLRACRPSDCDAIKEAHAKVLPIQYDEDFFKRICWTKGSYFSVCALSTSEPQRLAGFLSARSMPPKCFCFNDRQALQQIARDMGCRVVMLHTKSGNDGAVSLYLKHRFIRLRRHRGFYRLPSPHAPPAEQTLHDGLVFALPLHTPAAAVRPRGSRVDFPGDDAAACVSPRRHTSVTKPRVRTVVSPPGGGGAAGGDRGSDAAEPHEAAAAVDGAAEDPDECHLWLEEPDVPPQWWAGTCSSALVRCAEGALRAVLCGAKALLPLQEWLQGFSKRVVVSRVAPKTAVASGGPRAARHGSTCERAEGAPEWPQGASGQVDLEAGHQGGLRHVSEDRGGMEALARSPRCRGRTGASIGSAAGSPTADDEGVVGIFRRLFKQTRR